VEAELFDVTFDILVYGGDAMGRLPDGRAVFTPFILPGETARIRLTEGKKGFARGALVEILQPSPARIPARCMHFGVCGGCHYQHLAYPAQLAAKKEILKDQLVRIGGLDDPPIADPVAAPEPWYYRNHVQFHLTPDGKLGYHAARSDKVIPIEECHLPAQPLNELWPLLEVEPLPDLSRISLRLGAEDDVLLALQSRDPEPPAFSLDLAISAVHLGPDGPKVLSGYNYLVIEVLGRPFRVSAEAFFQVNTSLAGALVTHIQDHLSLTPTDTLLDIYCGVGLFSAFLAPRVGRLIGIESSPWAGDDFSVNLDEFNNVELYQAPAEEVVPYLDVQPEVALVDPPRSGLSRPVLDGLVALSPATLVYVSCDPATLARDARRLQAAGYTPRRITLFDLFPQTYHIESVSFWTKHS
jgi:23S rRNA (uracil1939-C5)-methyltransferase